MRKINKKGENFSFGVGVIVLSMVISLFAFISEDKDLVGLAASSLGARDADLEITINYNELMEFKDIGSLSTLAAGNYYIDNDRIVYWIDDESKPAIAKVNFVDESQKNRYIYIDNEGRIGYVLVPISLK